MTPTYDRVAARYDEHYTRAIDLAEDRVLYGLVARSNPQRVLDVGCGTGRLLDFVDPKVYVGVDPSAKMLEQARRKFGETPGGLVAVHRRNFGEAMAEQIGEFMSPVERMIGLGTIGTFDLACALWSFSYFQQPGRVLAAMYSALRPNGRAIVHAYAPRYRRRASYILEDIPFETCSVDELKMMMIRAGFRDVRARPFRVVPDAEPFASRAPVSLLARFLKWEMGWLPVNSGMTYVLSGAK